MKIGIDFRPALMGQAGIGRYTRELCRAMVPLLEDGEELVLFGVAYAEPCVEPFEIKDERVRLVRRRFPNRVLNLLGKIGLMGVERFTGPLDLFVHTDVVFPPLLSTPSVVMVYDLLFMRPETGFHSPAFCRKIAQRMGIALNGASAVMVPSEATLNDVDHFFPGLDVPIRVIPMGGDHLPPPLDPGLSGDYFLSVGTFEPRKNRIRILEAFEKLGPEGVNLVLVGRHGWMDEPFRRRLKASSVKDRVRLIEEEDDGRLSGLYAKALALIYPSLGEGFGLPLAEAFASGCPVITSDRSCLPEVAGGAAVLVDPLDVEALATAMHRMSTDPTFRQERIEVGRKRARILTWKRTAADTLDFLRTCRRS